MRRKPHISLILLAPAAAVAWAGAGAFALTHTQPVRARTQPPVSAGDRQQADEPAEDEPARAAAAPADSPATAPRKHARSPKHAKPYSPQERPNNPFRVPHEPRQGYAPKWQPEQPHTPKHAKQPQAQPTSPQPCSPVAQQPRKPKHAKRPKAGQHGPFRDADGDGKFGDDLAHYVVPDLPDLGLPDLLPFRGPAPIPALVLDVPQLPTLAPELGQSTPYLLTDSSSANSQEHTACPTPSGAQDES